MKREQVEWEWEIGNEKDHLAEGETGICKHDYHTMVAQFFASDKRNNLLIIAGMSSLKPSFKCQCAFLLIECLMI